MEARKTQLILTTHSPYLLDLLPLSSIVLVDRVEGEPQFTRPADSDAVQQWAKNFAPGHLYTMGRLYEEGGAGSKSLDAHSGLRSFQEQFAGMTAATLVCPQLEGATENATPGLAPNVMPAACPRDVYVPSYTRAPAKPRFPAFPAAAKPPPGTRENDIRGSRPG